MDYRLSEITTIIFDLGEVIVDLDGPAVLKAFNKAAGTHGDEFHNFLIDTTYLFDYETGRMTDQEFVHAINAHFKSDISTKDFYTIWNLMIKEIPLKRLELIQQLKKSHQILVLSNTNAMHEHYFEGIMKERIGQTMKDLVNKAYYSHHINLRKPNHNIYEYVITKEKLEPGKALFLDDKAENVIAAREVGLKAVQVQYPDQIFELLA